jgi:HD-like signal output (HDOD) protein
MTEEATIDALQATIKRTDTLPTISAIGQRLLTLRLDTDEGERELMNLVESDPMIAARIIGLANSPVFAPAKKICSIKDAAMVLGLSRVKAIAVSIALMGPLRIRDSEHFSIKSLWLHSFSMAVGMRTLSGMIPREIRPPEEQLFLAGLLHDIGFLAFAYLEPKKFDEFIAKIEADPERPITDIELETLGISHAQLGEMLGRHWGLPEEIVTVIAGHHGSGVSHDPMLTLARITERILGSTASIREEMRHISIDEEAAELEILGLQSVHLEKAAFVISQQQEQIRILADMLGG